ncbi:MAG: hypothetical protein ABTD50_00820 [Polyangiaceae bacterium]|jgi:hypothetical protein
MGIDRIGSNPPSLPAAEPLTPSSGPGASTFSVALTGPVGSSAAVEAPTTPLQQLQAGQIDRGTYLDLKVREATEHLSMLSPEELSSVRAALRDRLGSDPALVELARLATGRVPDASTDE